MAAEFLYANTLRAGPPVYDAAFLRQHPPMDRTHRAKIFAPFAALDGFEHTLRFKDIVYSPKTTLSEEETDILDEKLRILGSLTDTGKKARKNRTIVTVEYFSPCTDIYSDAYGTAGTYETVEGIVWLVDQVKRILLVGEAAIDFDNIHQIEGAVFDKLQSDLDSQGSFNE